MTPEHHLVRNLAVRELPYESGRPMKVDRLAATLGLPLASVRTIVEDLERHLFFLVRNGACLVETTLRLKPLLSCDLLCSHAFGHDICLKKTERPVAIAPQISGLLNKATYSRQHDPEFP
jgi:hypothetical protein